MMTLIPWPVNSPRFAGSGLGRCSSRAGEAGPEGASFTVGVFQVAKCRSRAHTKPGLFTMPATAAADLRPSASLDSVGLLSSLLEAAPPPRDAAVMNSPGCLLQAVDKRAWGVRASSFFTFDLSHPPARG